MLILILLNQRPIFFIRHLNFKNRKNTLLSNQDLKCIGNLFSLFDAVIILFCTVAIVTVEVSVIDGEGSETVKVLVVPVSSACANLPPNTINMVNKMLEINNLAIKCNL